MRELLDPELRQHLEKLDQEGEQLVFDDHLDLEKARADDLVYAASLMEPLPEYANVVVEDFFVPVNDHKVAVRLFTPDGLPDPAPAWVFIHGGGFVFGSIWVLEKFYKQVAAETGCKLFAVDYRLAPENPYPIPLMDCYQVVTWVFAHRDRFGLDEHKFLLGGDSAGGNLTAAVVHKLRDDGKLMVTHQVLIVPALDLASKDSESKQHFSKGFMLDADAQEWFNQQYIPDPELCFTPYVSPLRAADFRGLPTTLIFTAECDPLRDDGRMYAQALERSGVQVHYTCFKGMVHPFFVLQRFSEGARQATLDMLHQVRSHLYA